MELQDRHDSRAALLKPTIPDGPHVLRMGEAERQRSLVEGAAGEPGAADARHDPSLSVRRARVGDLPALTRILDRELLNLPASSAEESDPVRTGMRGLLPFMRRDRAVFVASDDQQHRLAGFTQFRVVGPDQRWVMESLGVDVRDDATPVVEHLVHYAVSAAGMSGVKRLYARVGVGRPIEVPLRQIGFAPYMREAILAAPAVPALAVARGVRIQEQADVWSIHQLYMASTPRQVQYAEALTSHGWDVGAMRRSNGYGCRGWIVADDHLAVGYARAISRRDAHVLEFMIAPDQRYVFPDLIATAFAHLAAMSPRDVYVVVRDYQSECAAFLLEQGFEYMLEQHAHVKYTTASARSSAVAAASFAVEGAEPAAKRVPTFLHGAPDLFYDVEGAGGPDHVARGRWIPSGRGHNRRRRDRSPSGQWSVD